MQVTLATKNSNMLYNNKKIYNKNSTTNSIVKKINSKSNSNSDDLKISSLKSELLSAQSAEQNIQKGLSFLQEKNLAASSLEIMGEKLKDLSVKYNNSNLTDDQKASIEKESEKVLNTMNTIMDTNFNKKDGFSNTTVDIESTNNLKLILPTKVLNINMDTSKYKSSENTNKKSDTITHIEGNLDIKDVLKDTDRISKKVLNPLHDYINDVRNKMLDLGNNANYEDMLVNSSVNDLYNMGAIDKYTKGLILNLEGNLVKANRALSAQCSNIDRNNVLKLLN
jgi:flagellin-like hook-associated protein FlgL